MAYSRSRSECFKFAGGSSLQAPGNAVAEACLSGCWRDVHIEGEGFGVGVVVPGVALQGERDG